MKKLKISVSSGPAHLNNKGIVIFQAIVVVVVACVVVLIHVGDAVVEQVSALLLVVWPPCQLKCCIYLINLFVN